MHIIFKDITTLMQDKKAFRNSIDQLAKPFLKAKIEYVVGVEARGFIFGAPLAYKLGAGFVPVRKKGKLPYKTISREYAMEYANNILEMHEDTIKPGEKVVIIDDVMAFGATLEATCEMIEKLGGEIVGIGLLSNLKFLNSKESLKKYVINTLIEY